MATDEYTATDLRIARRASLLSIGWSALAGTTMIVVGVMQSTTALVAVGGVGYVDGVGSLALMHHFAHGLRHAALDDRFERRAHRLVTVGLFVVGAATVAASTVRLAVGATSDGGRFGVVVAGLSALVLAVLAVVKVRVGRRIPSPALVADGRVSAIGAAQGAVACLGALLTIAFDAPRADPIAALLVVAAAIGLATRSWNAPIG